MNEEDRRHFDLLGRISALEILIVRLCADIARKDDTSTAAWMLDRIDAVVASVKEGMPPGAEHMSVLIEPHLGRYLHKARDLRTMKNP